MAWMAWTWPSALFFCAIFLMLLGMTVWGLRRPTVERRGFLPMATTRGDRLFISLLSAAFIHLAWLAFFDSSVWPASLLAVLFGAFVGWKG